MVRRGVVRTEVHVVRADEQPMAWESRVLFAAHGRWEIATLDQPPDHTTPSAGETLDADAGVWWDADPRSWALTARTPNAAMIAVRMMPDTLLAFGRGRFPTSAR